MRLVVFCGIFLLFLAEASGKSLPLDLKELDILFQADVNANCPDGYTKPINSNFTYCYQVFNDFKTAVDAAQQCALAKGTLASVSEEYIDNYIYYLAAKADAASVLLGIVCFNGDKKTCENDDGTPFGYNNFIPGQPDQLGNCVSMSATGKTSQQWTTFDCKKKSEFACEVPVGGGVNPTLSCPASYILFKDKCYKYVDLGGAQISSDNATAECRKIPGGNLATVQTEPVNDFLVNLQPTAVRKNGALFGLRCPNVSNNGDTSSCKWDDGTPFGYSNFATGYPSTSTAQPSYGHIFTGLWYTSTVPNQKYPAYYCQAPGL